MRILSAVGMLSVMGCCTNLTAPVMGEALELFKDCHPLWSKEDVQEFRGWFGCNLIQCWG